MKSDRLVLRLWSTDIDEPLGDHTLRPKFVVSYKEGCSYAYSEGEIADAVQLVLNQTRDVSYSFVCDSSAVGEDAFGNARKAVEAHNSLVAQL